MTENPLKLTKQDSEKIAQNYPGGEHDFSHQDLDETNLDDARDWLCEDVLVGLVSEVHGGIIGYVHEKHADDIVSILNLHAIDRLKNNTQSDKNE